MSVYTEKRDKLNEKLSFYETKIAEYTEKKKAVIETLAAQDREILYDFDLNMQGGHITGYKVLL